MRNRRRSAGMWLLLGCSLGVMMAVDLAKIHAYLQSLIVAFPSPEVQAVGHPPSNSTRLPRNGRISSELATGARPFAGDEPLIRFKQPSNNATNRSLPGSAIIAALRQAANRTAPIAPSSEAPRADASRDRSSTIYYFSVARTDRSGSAIHDMVLALAYAHSKRAKYGGACNSSNPIPGRLEERKMLIRELGLEGALKFACPTNLRTDRMIKKSVYWSLQGELLSPRFLQWLWSTQVKPTPGAASGGNGTGSGGAVVHIRRGDVSPCGELADRYSPNSHYAEVLKRHVPRGVPVTIYSESYSPIEPWDAAAELANYTIRLDTDVAEVWRAIASAQYVVLSKSSFSYTPALLNPHNATIIYTPPFLKTPPLPGWVAVGDDLVRRSQARVQHLSQTRCGSSQNKSVTSDYWHWRQRQRQRNDTLSLALRRTSS